MKKSMVFLLAGLYSSMILAGEVKKKVTVHFESDEYVLPENAVFVLENLVASIDLSDDYSITISGHTDNAGTNGYNDQLSENRAKAVRDFLINKGIDVRFISHSYFGERKPITNNTDAEKMQQNRRVEVTYASFYFVNEQELLDRLSSDYVNTFIIDPNVENRLAGNHGIALKISALSFTDEEGRPFTKKVEVVLKEGVDYQSFIGHNLFTHSDGSMIESDGMFYLDAIGVDGAKLTLKEDNPIAVSLPTMNRKEDMELFISDNGQEWTSTGPIDAAPVEVLDDATIKLIDIPRFVPRGYVYDRKTMPRPPKKPRVPGNPHEPRIESYQPANTIWNNIFKKQASRKANDRYLAAVNNYLENASQYEVYMANYLISKERYFDEYEHYERQYDRWLQVQDSLAGIDRERQYKEYMKFWAPSKSYNDSVRMADIMLYEQRRKQRITAQAKTMDRSGSASLNDGFNYALDVVRFGWFNADKYVNEAKENALALWDNDVSDEHVMLIMPTLRGLVGFNKFEDSYRLLAGVPKEAPQVVFGFKVMDGKPYVYLHRVDEHDKNLEMSFTRTRFSELQGIFRDLNRNVVARL